MNAVADSIKPSTEKYGTGGTPGCGDIDAIEGDRMPYPFMPEDERVDIVPSELVERRSAAWQGLGLDVVSVAARAPYDCHFKAPRHLLIATEQAEREDGETVVEGLPKSTLHNFSGKLTFVPAGHEFHGWQNPLVPARVSYFYIDPRGSLFDNELRFSEIDFRPRLFFVDRELWQIADKLKNEGMIGGARLAHYGEALGAQLARELVRLNGPRDQRHLLARGGLSGWQQRKVADFIDAHLADDVRLSALAGLVDLSPYHFTRAFKQSFGAPPHRYHVGRRIERAKTLLEKPASSVTEVALSVGFAETSSFSTAFRKQTGVSPSDYRRGFGGPRIAGVGLRTGGG
jgi:AraC-like DNA-binding protein